MPILAQFLVKNRQKQLKLPWNQSILAKNGPKPPQLCPAGQPNVRAIICPAPYTKFHEFLKTWRAWNRHKLFAIYFWSLGKNWIFPKNQSTLVTLRRWASEMFSIKILTRTTFNSIWNYQQNVQANSVFLSRIVPDLFSVDSQGQKDRQVQRDRYKDKDVLYHRMPTTLRSPKIIPWYGSKSQSHRQVPFEAPKSTPSTTWSLKTTTQYHPKPQNNRLLSWSL